MLDFESQKLTINYVDLKHVTTALGGSITVVDHQQSTDDTEVTKKVNVPYAVARAFCKLYSQSKFFNPVKAAVVMYDGVAVAIELETSDHNGTQQLYQLEDSMFESDKRWVSCSERNVDRLFKLLHDHDDWKTDGQYIYRVVNENSTILSSDHKFQTVDVDAFKLRYLAHRESPSLDRRSSIGINVGGRLVVSPPIWASVKTLGGVTLTVSDHDIEDENSSDDDSSIIEGEFPYDTIDQHRLVNLQFGLKAAKELSTAFGQSAIEPIKLHELMIEMNTVNLPNIAQSLKYTCAIGMNYTHAVAWLLGFGYRADKIEHVMMIRNLLKHLTTKGSFKPKKLQESFRRGHSVSTVPHLNVTDELAEMKKLIGQ